MDWLKLFIAEGLLGYFLQCGGCVVGICAVAKKQAHWLPLLITSVLFAISIYLIRTLGKFNFGVHTMLMLLIVNLLCVLILRVDIKPSILGSLIVTLMVLASEVVNYSLLLIFFDQAEITRRMTEPLFKAYAAVPGNVVFSIIVIFAYIKRAVKGKKLDYGKTG